MYDPAMQTFHKPFLGSQGASGGAHLALKAIPNKEWQQWQQGGPSPRERAVQPAAVSSGVFIAAALLFPASPPLCVLSVAGLQGASTSQWQDRGPGLVGGHCVLLSDINHRGFLAWLAWAHVACGLEGPVFWGATLLPTYCY